jgi:uncharacterized protein (DUF952 family)/GNAT superfamily N-acetyltransferase
VSEPLLHLVTTEQWREAVAGGVVAPPSLGEVGFVHLSTPAQVHLPADRLLHGRSDVWLLVLAPDRIGVEVRYEPGVPTDPESMRFPHAYGPVPLAAITSVLPYRPGRDGGFAPPRVPAQDAAGRVAAFEPSLLRRAATAEVPVIGGVAVLTEPVPASYRHNQLLVDEPVAADEVVAEADRVLGGAGLCHRRALVGAGPTAAGLAERGWSVEPLVGMAAPVGEPDGPAPGAPWAEQVARLRLRGFWAAGWRRDQPGITPDEIAQLSERYDHEEPVTDLRYLAVFADRRPVSTAILKIDGGTALLDVVATAPEYRGQGYGDALLRTAHTLAATAGCDLLTLWAAERDWPRHWYARRGFTEVTRVWEATLAPPPG